MANIIKGYKLGSPDGNATHVAWSPTGYLNPSSNAENYFSEITGFQKTALDLSARLAHFIKKTNTKHLTYFISRGLRLLSTPQYTFKSKICLYRTSLSYSACPA